MHVDLPKTRFISVARLRRSVSLGMKSIWLHGLRSLLTVLGIVFGVCSVIAMLAVGEGASANVQEQIRRLGSNNIIIQSQKPSQEQKNTTGQSRVLEYGLTYSDIRTIQNVVPNVQIVLPSRIIRDYAWNETRNVDADIVGTVPTYAQMRHLQVLDGRFFTDHDMNERRNVAVLGENLAMRLYPIQDPIGRNVKIGSDYYSVIGVVADENAGDNNPGGSAGGRSGSFRMYIPLTAAQHRFGETLIRRTSGSFESEKVELHEAIVQVSRPEDVIGTSQLIGQILERKHKQDDYRLIVPLELLRNAEETKRIFNLVLGAIAGISLLVGGIGIMNIMLATVTERTREIGIRRALGAKKRDIVLQFLVETVLLSGTGGLLGVVLGISIPLFITWFSGMPTKVTLWSPLLAFTISGMVGILFGIYPAMRAANMDPVEALRHE